jgi:hypothetical protein
VEQLVTERHEDHSIVDEGVRVQADVGALVIDEPGAVAAEKATVVVRRCGSVTDRDLPMVQAELGAQAGEVLEDNSLDGGSVQRLTS